MDAVLDMTWIGIVLGLVGTFAYAGFAALWHLLFEFTWAQSVFLAGGAMFIVTSVTTVFAQLEELRQRLS